MLGALHEPNRSPRHTLYLHECFPLKMSDDLAFNNLAFNDIATEKIALNDLAFNNIAFNGLAFSLAFDDLAFNNLSFDNLASMLRLGQGYMCANLLTAVQLDLS